ncbi:hypothetical protein ACP70R_020372 [Stipagrostis hirtigluma subsp. patula]
MTTRSAMRRGAGGVPAPVGQPASASVDPPPPDAVIELVSDSSDDESGDENPGRLDPWYLLSESTRSTPRLLAALSAAWDRADKKMPMYAVKITGGHLRGCMFFSKDFSKFLRPRKEKVEIWFRGGLFAGRGAEMRMIEHGRAYMAAINKYSSGIAMFTNGWKDFVDANGLAEGQLVVMTFTSPPPGYHGYRSICVYRV